MTKWPNSGLCPEVTNKSEQFLSSHHKFTDVWDYLVNWEVNTLFQPFEDLTSFTGCFFCWKPVFFFSFNGLTLSAVYMYYVESYSLFSACHNETVWINNVLPEYKNYVSLWLILNTFLPTSLQDRWPGLSEPHKCSGKTLDHYVQFTHHGANHLIELVLINSPKRN